MNCSEEYTELTCTDPGSTVLFDEVRPEHVRLDRTNRVGDQLLTLRSKMVNMTIEVNVLTRVKRIEVELLDCERVGISVKSVRFSADSIPLVMHPRSSCDKLAKVCLPLNPATTSRQMVFNLTARNPFDWIAISRITFYTEVESCDVLSNDVGLEMLEDNFTGKKSMLCQIQYWEVKFVHNTVGPQYNETHIAGHLG